MAAEAGEEEAGPMGEDKDDLFHLNVGAWIFSIPKNKLAPFPESLLYREACALPESDRKRIFLDRDGFVFTRIHQFLLTSQLPMSSSSDLELLYEQARGLNLPALIEAIDKLKAGKEEKTLHKQTTPDIPASEKTTKNYWKSHKCSNKLSAWPLKMSSSPGIQDRAPFGLLHNPLLDAEEEVHYCFFPTDILETYPALVTDENLLWFSEKFILIECGCPEFRFIGNFLHYGSFFLPENFSAFDDLEAEMNSLEIPGLLKALYDEKKSSGFHSRDMPVIWNSNNILTASEAEHPGAAKPFYIMSLELLGKYPDSALGQLYIESSVDGRKLYICGTGSLFQHAKNWLGACRLPLTSSALEIQDLCLHLDKGDIIYQPMREAMRAHLKHRRIRSPGTRGESWRADVQQYCATQIVRVFVRSHWYATHLKTLLKYPELLANCKKTRWMVCGFSLLVSGDGSIFRHILNFLRLDRLLLPSDFKEWRLLCQEVNEFQISALKEALCHCVEYRLWLRKQESTECSLDSKHENMRRNVACQQMLYTHRSHGSSKVKDEFQGRGLLNTFPTLSRKSRRCVADELKQHKLSHLSPGYPEKQITKIKSFASNGEDKDNVVRPIHRSGSLSSVPVQKDNVNLLDISHKDNIKLNAGPEDELLHYIKVSPFLAKCTDQRMEEDGATSIEHAYHARSPHMEGKTFADLGAILWVHHHHLMTNDGSTASFQDCIVYTTEEEIKKFTGHGETSDDLVFLSVNMSHEEIFYARKCHFFLTGVILDSLEQRDPKSTTSCVAGLVSMLWTSQIPARQFVDDLFALEMYKDEEDTKAALLSWLTLTLTYAKKLSQCITVMLKKQWHKSSSSCILRKVLR
ncbi:BTB/POZ domain-containing protein KCTD19 [Mantella aurantiaca]